MKSRSAVVVTLIEMLHHHPGRWLSAGGRHFVEGAGSDHLVAWGDATETGAGTVGVVVVVGEVACP